MPDFTDFVCNEARNLHHYSEAVLDTDGGNREKDRHDLNAEHRPSTYGRCARATMGILGLALSSLVWSPGTSAWEINFEGLADGTIINESAFGVFNLGGGLEATFGAKDWLGNTNPAVTLFTGAPTVDDSDLEAPFTRLSDGKVLNPGNVAILQERPCDIVPNGICEEPDDIGHRPAGMFSIDFNFDVFLDSIDFFDIESEEDGETDGNRILLKNSANAVIHPTFFTPDTGGDNRWDRKMFLAGGVRHIEIYMGGSGAIDNIRGGTTTVPEPATLLLLAFGLLGLPVARRAR
jgi:hypothetical protein